MHLVAPCCTLYLASQPVLRGCTLHSRPADRPAGNSLLLPLLARAGSRLLDKVRGGARGESNPTIILTCLTMVLHPLHAPTPPPCLYDLPFSPQPPFFCHSQVKASHLQSFKPIALLVAPHPLTSSLLPGIKSLWAEREREM